MKGEKIYIIIAVVIINICNNIPAYCINNDLNVNENPFVDNRYIDIENINVLDSYQMFAVNDNFNVGDYEYTIIDEINKYVKISGYNGGGGVIVLPSNIIYDDAAYQVKEIGDYVFRNENEVTGLAISHGIERIGHMSFWGCQNIDGDIIIPSTVNDIGMGAFSACTRVDSLSVVQGSQHYKSIDNVIYNLSGTKLISYLSGKNNESFSIPDTVTQVNGFALAYALNLETVEFGENIETIGQGAFFHCENINDLLLDGSISTIEYNAFNSCYALYSITINNDNITLMGDDIFTGCSNITIRCEKNSNAYNYCISNSINYTTDMNFYIIGATINSPKQYYQSAKDDITVELTCTNTSVISFTLKFVDTSGKEVDVIEGIETNEYIYEIPSLKFDSMLTIFVLGYDLNGDLICSDSGDSFICLFESLEGDIRDEKQNQQIEDFVDEYSSEQYSDFERIKAAHDYIVLRVNYDQSVVAGTILPYQNDASDIRRSSFYMEGVFVDQVAVCDGYSKAFEELMNKLGIECGRVLSTNINHSWNYVELDGDYYEVDCTWDDPITSTTYPSSGNKFPVEKGNYIRYDYFLREVNSHEDANDVRFVKKNIIQGIPPVISTVAYKNSFESSDNYLLHMCSKLEDEYLEGETINISWVNNTMKEKIQIKNMTDDVVLYEETYDDVNIENYNFDITNTLNDKELKINLVGYDNSNIEVARDEHVFSITEKVQLLVGDVNEDGNTNIADYNIIRNSSNFNKTIDTASIPICDINGDGNINMQDANIVRDSTNFNKTNMQIEFN